MKIESQLKKLLLIILVVHTLTKQISACISLCVWGVASTWSSSTSTASAHAASAVTSAWRPRAKSCAEVRLLMASVTCRPNCQHNTQLSIITIHNMKAHFLETFKIKHNVMFKFNKSCKATFQLF